MLDLIESLPAGPFAFGALLLTAVAAGWDLSVRRIPNAITITAMLLGLSGHLAVGGGSGLVWSAAGMAVGLGILLLPFLFGGMGAGDLKLMGALGALLGPGPVFEIALVSAMAGGLIALLVAMRRGVAGAALERSLGFLRPRSWAVAASSPQASAPLPGALGTIPYGVAIGVGTWICTLGGGLF
jgi:prepilin peptidase CpaA